MNRAKEVDGLPFRDSHRALIRCWEIMADDAILPEDKIAGCHKGLFGKTEFPEAMSARLDAFFALWRKPHEGGGERVFDFLYDYDLVYAAFMQAYGIDIEDGDIPIARFLALFDGLPQGTRLAEVMELRAKKPPKRTASNAEYINALMRAKRAVALPCRTPEGASWRNRLATAVENLSKAKK